MRRTSIRASDAFYDDIRAALPAERGPNGEPSASDFIAFALPDVIEVVAEQYDVLPFEPTTPGVRVLIAPTPFGAVVVYATDTADDVVHLIAFRFDDKLYDW